MNRLFGIAIKDKDGNRINYVYSEQKNIPAIYDNLTSAKEMLKFCQDNYENKDMFEIIRLVPFIVYTNN